MIINPSFEFTSQPTMDYIKALEDERKKIIVFEKELPLSLQIISKAIETCKQQMGSEDSDGPVLEEFMPLRPSCSSSDEETHRKNDMGNGVLNEKPDWLRSVRLQLWNQSPQPKEDVLRKPIAVNATRIGGAFHPFEREKVVVKSVVDAPASSTTGDNTNGVGVRSAGVSRDEKEKEEKDKEGSSQRKARRCWSPELHRRFLQALQQLGGSTVATPKQIRELMKVDGLTNDEVKSHLQKYRLHIRRPSTPPNQSSNNGSPQQPQIVLVGGLWMPAPSNTVYAPVSSLPSEMDSNKLKNNNRSPTGPLNSGRKSTEDDKSDEDGERTNSDSSATSSSSQTTTAFPLARLNE